MNRVALNTKLKGILGTNNVYFQPPENVKMVYPCFVYERDRASGIHANNELYKWNMAYTITYISKEVDTIEVIEKILALPMCRQDRHFKSDNLNHDVFKIYI